MGVFSSRQRYLSALSYQLATGVIPVLIAILSLLSLFVLQPNDALQHRLVQDMPKAHHYYWLEGAIWALALSAILLSFYKKNVSYLIAGLWCLCNLRLGSVFLGYDHFWLQHQLPAQLVPYMNQLTVGMYYVLSQQLLQRLLGTAYLNSTLHHSLNNLALLMLAITLVPSTSLFKWSLAIILPISLCLVLLLSLQRLRRIGWQLYLWQILLLSILFCATVSYVLHWIAPNVPLLPNFTAFILLALCNALILFVFMDHIRLQKYRHYKMYSSLHNNVLPIVYVDEQGYIQYANRAFKRLGRRLHPGPLRRWQQLFPEMNWKYAAKSSQLGGHLHVEPLKRHIKLFEHDPYTLLVKKEANYFIVTLQPTNSYTENNHHALGDAGGNMLNQHGLEKALHYTLQNFNHYQPCFLAYIELDHIHQAQRSYGHAASDELVGAIQQRLACVLEEHFAFGRIGSDDFVFLLPQTNAQKAQQSAQRIYSALTAEPIHTQLKDYVIDEMAIGVIELNPAIDAQCSLRIAQRVSLRALQNEQAVAMYEYGSPEMQYQLDELALFKQLEQGDAQGLYLEMQPLMALANPLSHYNVEVLLRMQRKDKQSVPIYEFIQAAEANGSIIHVDKWVLNSSLEWLQQHHVKLPQIRLVNVNLSGYSLNNDQFIQDLFLLLDQYQSVRHKLCIEITEGVALYNKNRTRELMQNLQKKGVRIALDDFGAGYTSFSYLRELPADFIKIDGALIKDMNLKAANTAIVRAIVELATSLGISCVAEWVEDTATLELLKDLGVDYAQGYAIAKSLSLKTIKQAYSIVDLMDSAEGKAFISTHYTTIGGGH